MNVPKYMKVKRQLRIRAKISGDDKRPRLAVFRSNQALSAQLVDDVKRVTIASVRVDGKNAAKAKELGQKIAAIAKEKGITTVVFDRGGFQYHGNIKQIADSAREGGLQF